MKNARQQRLDHLQSKKEWLDQRLSAMDLPWPFNHRFEYNENYDLWRASYDGKVRQMIRDYQVLERALQLDGQYELTIESDCICVRKPLGFNVSLHEMLLADIPLDEPLEPEDFASFNYSLKPPIIIGFLSTKLKSHLHRFHKKSQLVLLVDLYIAEFCRHGYTLQVFSNGGWFVIMMTHATETPDACAQFLADEGYVPYDVAQARAEAAATPVSEPAPDMKALLAKEQALLEDLATVRKQIEYWGGSSHAIR
jgi:hypothetical protein